MANKRYIRTIALRLAREDIARVVHSQGIKINSYSLRQISDCAEVLLQQSPFYLNRAEAIANAPPTPKAAEIWTILSEVSGKTE